MKQANKRAATQGQPCAAKQTNGGKCTTLHTARVDFFAAHVLTGLFAAQGREAFNVHPDTAGYYAKEIAHAVVRAMDDGGGL